MKYPVSAFINTFRKDIEIELLVHVFSDTEIARLSIKLVVLTCTCILGNIVFTGCYTLPCTCTFMIVYSQSFIHISITHALHFYLYVIKGCLDTGILKVVLLPDFLLCGHIPQFTGLVS